MLPRKMNSDSHEVAKGRYSSVKVHQLALFSAQYPPHLGGIENFTQGLARALVARGNRVIVVTNDTEGLGAGFSSEEDVEVLRLPCHPLVSGRLPIPRLGAEYRSFIQRLDETLIDGVLVNARFYPHSLLGMRVARRHGIRPVVLDHGSAYLSFSNPVLDPAARLYEHVMSAWGKRYDAVYYGISKKSVEWLGTFGIRAEGVIPNAIDAAGYCAAASRRNFRGELGLTENDLMVAFVGRLIPEKGVSALIEASRNERLHSAGVTLVLAGDGPLAADVSAAESPTLRWVGRLSREDTAALLLQSDYMCLPTRSEGFSTTLLEASACGCPSLVTDVGGARELIPDEGYGRIMPDAAAETIVQEVLALRECQSELPLMGERCKRLAEDRFSWDATAAATEKALYQARLTRGNTSTETK